MAAVQRESLVRGTGLGSISFVVRDVLTWILAGVKASALATTGPFGGPIAVARCALARVRKSLRRDPDTKAQIEAGTKVRIKGGAVVGSADRTPALRRAESPEETN